MLITFDDATKQAREILERALSAGAEMLITHDKSPEEILSQAEKIYDTFTETVKKITGRNIQAAMNEGGISAEALRVTVEEMCNDYNANTIRAKRKYAGRTLTVSGKIHQISTYNRYDDADGKIPIMLQLLPLPSDKCLDD